MSSIFQTSEGLPVGTIQMWAMLTPPNGWLLCDGSVLDKALYPELHEMLKADGFLYGGDDNGAMLPNLEQRFPFGSNYARASDPVPPANLYPPGQTGGVSSVTLTVNQMPSHDHAVIMWEPGHYHGGLSYGGSGGGPPNNSASWTVGGASAGANSTFGWTGQTTAGARVYTDNKWDYSRNTGGGQAHDNMPPYIAVNFIIKVA